MSEKRTRMSGFERREQLVAVGRSLFALKGFDATSVEEIAAKAKVSKPVVYEHFGGKEGLYAVIVDREVQSLVSSLHHSLESSQRPRVLLENATLALLDYVESNTDGFRVLVRDAPTDRTQGSFSSVLGDVASKVEHLLAEQFDRTNINPNLAPLYAQMLVGLIAQVGQWWLDDRRMKKDGVAAHVVNLVWNGVRNMRPAPTLIVRSSSDPPGKNPH
ncbi:TetR/AcrR family transcriptional regulator [Actinomyces mediterranea]|uniref:TetR/AcrR family transcriptional regulator n=1 Tax=Actinomyces mediterranea TaxID=1871028 RepID=UPI0009706005|nr:TetR/AcrR family transcriptional regulator [Actinomyces mediterranea]